MRHKIVKMKIERNTKNGNAISKISLNYLKVRKYP
jgi:hypothetical protein